MPPKFCFAGLKQPAIMAVLNITPDSFADGGGAFHKPEYHLLKLVENHIDNGADIIDIGAESTRPGATTISYQQQITRLGNIISKIKDNFEITLSIDSTELKVMQFAYKQGIDIINDINALEADGVIDWLTQTNLSCILMHRSGNSKVMQSKTQYHKGVVTAVASYLQQRVNTIVAKGIAANRICIDPGFGFGKTLQQNLDMLNNLTQFKLADYPKIPILAGLSRKSLLQDLCKQQVADRLSGSLGLALTALIKGATILRVHDTFETKAIVDIYKVIVNC